MDYGSFCFEGMEKEGFCGACFERSIEYMSV